MKTMSTKGRVWTDFWSTSEKTPDKDGGEVEGDVLKSRDHFYVRDIRKHQKFKRWWKNEMIHNEYGQRGRESVTDFWFDTSNNIKQGMAEKWKDTRRLEGLREYEMVLVRYNWRLHIKTINEKGDCNCLWVRYIGWTERKGGETVGNAEPISGEC